MADDEPARWRDVLGHVCAVAGSVAPAPGGLSLMPSFRVRNARARDALSWTPRYASFREGLAR